MAILIASAAIPVEARPGGADRGFDRPEPVEQPDTLGLPPTDVPAAPAANEPVTYPDPIHGLQPHYQDNWSGQAPEVGEPEPSASQYLNRLKRLNSHKPEDEQEALRLRSLRSEGLRLGVRIGLSERYAQIEQMLESNAPLLDASYNFNPLLIDDVVLPPVIHEAQGAFRRVDSRTARATRTSFRIEYPARIVALAPTWREFLIKRFEMPEDPNPILLPRNRVEAQAWESALEKGWRKGQVQADRIYESNLAVLTRTLEGMVKYRVLLAKGMVSKPDVRTNELGIVHDGKTLNVGDVIYTLEGDVDFTEARRWLAVPEERRPMRR